MGEGERFVYLYPFCENVPQCLSTSSGSYSIWPGQLWQSNCCRFPTSFRSILLHFNRRPVETCQIWPQHRSRPMCGLQRVLVRIRQWRGQFLNCSFSQTSPVYQKCPSVSNTTLSFLNCFLTESNKIYLEKYEKCMMKWKQMHSCLLLYQDKLYTPLRSGW